jgi:peptide/nickel transport system permease protein
VAAILEGGARGVTAAATTVTDGPAVSTADGNVDRGLLRWLGGRLAFAAGVLVVLSIVVFLATSALPGSVVDQILGTEATPQARTALEQELRLDEPVVQRYASWATSALQGDFGSSLVNGAPVWPLVLERLGHSLLLAGAALLIALPLAIVLGSWSALRAGRRADRAITGAAFVLICIPEFVVGILLIWLFAVVVPVLPAISLIDSGASLREWLEALALPVLTLVPAGVAYMTRTMRFAMADVLGEDFIRMAPLRGGVSRRRVILRHALPNALVPMVNVFALQVGFMLTGVVVVEALFQYPGLGLLLLDAVSQHDIPIVQATALVMGGIYVLLSVAADLLVAVLDPRIAQRTA